jgi:hypothetical protein
VAVRTSGRDNQDVQIGSVGDRVAADDVERIAVVVDTMHVVNGRHSMYMRVELASLLVAGRLSVLSGR